MNTVTNPLKESAPMTLANKITITRLLFLPVFIILLLQGYTALAAALFTALILTDALDGFIARWKKQRTALGSFLDPLADKLLMFSSFLSLAYLGMIPLWIFIVILSRDLLIVLGWTITYLITGSRDVEPRPLGKITTIFQMTAIWLVLLQLPATITEKFLLITVIATTLSGFDYVSTGSRRLNHHA